MIQEILRRARHALSILQPGVLAIRPFRCALCGPSLLLRLAPTPSGVRCLRCAASAAALSLATVLHAHRAGFAAQAVYELSARGPFCEYLQRTVADLTCSEFLDGVPPGAVRDGVLCQDVQRLTFADASFDVCTSTEVFEHVPDDALGFRELRRVLRAEGILVFTVPLSSAERSVERAVVRDGRLEHLLEPAYHDDRQRGRGKVLVFRDYGRDIVARLRAQGFARATIDARAAGAFLGHGCPVVVAWA